MFCLAEIGDNFDFLLGGLVCNQYFVGHCLLTRSRRRIVKCSQLQEGNIFLSNLELLFVFIRKAYIQKNGQ